jgi:hypothetical protein
MLRRSRPETSTPDARVKPGGRPRITTSCPRRRDRSKLSLRVYDGSHAVRKIAFQSVCMTGSTAMYMLAVSATAYRLKISPTESIAVCNCANVGTPAVDSAARSSGAESRRRSSAAARAGIEPGERFVANAIVRWAPELADEAERRH